jgi:rRNA maturation RNase YbeY
VPVELTCRTESGRPFAAALRADALALLKILELEHCELSLMLVSDSGIRRLNREFRSKNRATDVLSFPQIELSNDLSLNASSAVAAPPPLTLGDIVISIDTARRQARELGQRANARIRTLLIHGTLHLLGYDHESSAAEARRMFAREHNLAALMHSALIDDADAKGPRAHLDPARPSTIGGKGPPTASTGKEANTKGDPGWSPAARAARSEKVMKRSSARRG